jgi:hypothetical protein
MKNLNFFSTSKLLQIVGIKSLDLDLDPHRPNMLDLDQVSGSVLNPMGSSTLSKIKKIEELRIFAKLQ